MRRGETKIINWLIETDLYRKWQQLVYRKHYPVKLYLHFFLSFAILLATEMGK